ncbi:PREDICTED: transcription factor bHLH96 [Theobroma cacao]|uniref:Transcription factor bHLH96 n=1 Tax=Theobroma cacao TaxID=3641 RepID=A0AB32UV01_THECC|nr:PREDICTED: transcription factor bHLH96 [Theobroma cacao]
MALEAVVYPQDPFTYACKDFYLVGGGAWGYDFCFQEEDKALLGILDNNIEQGSSPHLHANWDSSSTSVMQHAQEWDPYSSPEACTVDQSLPGGSFPPMEAPAAAAATATTTTTNSRRKRRRTRSSKNKEELENQRMTHITVERNRRKQMNEYLTVLRSLMPPSYVQRGDQASIIGGAINFVKELEQLLQSMEAHKRTTQQPEHNGYSSPFAEFFTFPQFSTHATQCNNPQSMAAEPMAAAESVADIEVTMVETHANLKILSKKRPRQLLKLVAGLQSLRLTILHLNVTTVEEMALYSISVKVEEGCHLNTVDEIAAAVNQMLRGIQEEAAFS